MKYLLFIGKWLLILVLILALIIIAFISLHPTFGGSPDKVSMQKILASKNYNGEIFVNLEPTNLKIQSATDDDMTMWQGMMSMIIPPKDKNPIEPLPSEKFGKRGLENGDFVWFGHSSVLFRTGNQTIMTDPVFYRASPVPFTGKAFTVTNKTDIADLPNIDAVLISHDHYDHLDYQTIQAIDEKVSFFYVPLGIKAHLQQWGIADDKIAELDWYNDITLGDVTLTLTPSRHFSGRNVHNRNSTLWASWVVKSPNLSLFFSGDSGYGKHYVQIGGKFGPFDLALMEDGAYNQRWAQVHMMPEQSVQAAIDLQAKNVLPIHWAKFDLAFHPWREPIERYLAEAKLKNVNVTTPKIGQVFRLDELPREKWWEAAK